MRASVGVMIATILFAMLLVAAIGAYAYKTYEPKPKK